MRTADHQIRPGLVDTGAAAMAIATEDAATVVAAAVPVHQKAAVAMAVLTNPMAAPATAANQTAATGGPVFLISSAQALVEAGVGVGGGGQATRSEDFMRSRC